ncbi:MAG TPA: DUF1538 domain-containing protein [Candidatus Izemoplasmatales bacterium]|nr:DUF1538 domain-containing protein [Candidatus Izemoplasmatales bacterium]
MGRKYILDKLREAVLAVTPISIAIIIIGLIIRTPNHLIINFVIGALFLIIGLTLFSIGSYQSTVALAESIGEYIVKKRKLWFFILIALLVGFFITAAEPNLWVLADQVKTVVSEPVMIMFVAFGIGFFITLAVLRILFQIQLRKLILVAYSLVITFAIIVYVINPEFVSLAFDAGGGATGPMAVPFILSFGYGISKARGDKSSEEDSFGLIGIAAIGPIVAVLFLGLFNNPTPPEIDLSTTFFGYFILSMSQMAIAILPFIIFFIAFHFLVFKYKKSKVIKTLIAFLYTYIGLVLFLTGANAGLVNIGHYIGSYLAQTGYSWTLVPIGMLFGFTIVSAEPSVITLNHQVEEVTAGAINRKLMMVALSIGVSFAIGLAMLRVLTGISILWFLLPGYAIALGLSFVTPKIFTSIAFDSGGAASGALTTAFLTPFAFGAADLLNANILLDAFGLIAFVVMAPLITIQLLGLVYKLKLKKVKMTDEKDEIIDLGEVNI